MALADTYHLSWTCYGQWLHGDVRGYVDHKHNVPGEPYEHDNPLFLNADANRMTEAACWLTDEQRRTAQGAIAEACAFRRWRLYAVNVQPDHSHVAVSSEEARGVRARQILKDRATRALREVDNSRRHWWTEGGKVEVVTNEVHLATVIDYIENKQKFPKVR